MDNLGGFRADDGSVSAELPAEGGSNAKGLNVFFMNPTAN